jgi:hypothetical protein
MPYPVKGFTNVTEYNSDDIVTDIKASIKLFADDTSLYVTVDTPPSAADIINRDLEQIHQYMFNRV